MSGDRSGGPEWVPFIAMEVTTSTEGAGPEEPCANPAQQETPAATLDRGSRDHLHTYFQARLAAIENRMGITPTEAPEPKENTEALGDLLTSTSDPREDLETLIRREALAPTEKDSPPVWKSSPDRPSPGSATPDTTMGALSGTEGEGIGSIGRAGTEGASSPDSAPAPYTPGEKGTSLGENDFVPVDSSPGIAELDLSWSGQGPEPSVPWTTYVHVKKERDRLSRKFDALQTAIPETPANKVIQFIQLKTDMARMQHEIARLARRERVTREANEKLEATLAAQAIGGRPAPHPGQSIGDGRTAQGARRSELDWIEQLETIDRLRAEKSHLAKRLADLITVVPAAFAARVKRIKQLEERAAQLQSDYGCLARRPSSCAERRKRGLSWSKKTPCCARFWGQRR